MEDSTAYSRQVQTGQVIGDMVEVLDGLKAGEQVILSGQINLEDGVRVSVIDSQ